MTPLTLVRGLALSTALGVAGAYLAAGAAVADTRVFPDARGDLDHGADIHRVRVDNADRIRIKVVHEDLRRSFRSGSSLTVFIDTDRKRRGPEFVFLAGTFAGSDYALLPARGWRRASDRQVPLRGGTYDMRLNFRKDTALLRVDRTVLRKPGAVRVEVKTGGEMVPPGGKPVTTGKDWLGKPRHFTRWVPRG